MSRSGPIVAALAGALVLGCLGVAPATAATPDEQAEEEQGPPQQAVAVPYQGEAKITPAAPWSVQVCPEAPDGLSVVCEPDGITLTAERYDPEWGEQVLTVGLGGPVGALEVRYRVILAPPEPPAAESLAWSYPIASGSQVLIPVAALAATCTLCTPGTALLEVGDVEPDAAGIATSTGMHVALRTTPGFTGDAIVPVRIIDDAGQPAEFELAVHIGPAAAAPFGGLHVLVPLPAPGIASVDLATLAWPDAVPDALFQCSAALTGVVACVDGVATYVAPERDPEAVAGADQFTVRFVAPGGQVALASVTLVPAQLVAQLGLAGSDPSLAPVVAGGSAPLLVALPVPPENGDAPAASAFDELAALLTRTGLAG